MTRKNNSPFIDRIVRIFDDKKNFRGTGAVLDNNGWILTCGHMFESLNVEDGISLNMDLAWTIQTSDGVHHNCDYLAEKFFDNRCYFDYALIKANYTHSFYKPLVVRRNVEEHRSAFMLGFSGASPLLLRIDGRIIGPTYIFKDGCTQPLLQLLWENQGSVKGFSGAPIFVKDPHIGTLLAGIQAKEYIDLQVQIGTPLVVIQKRSGVFSTTIATLSDIDYRRAGFRVEAVHDLSTLSGGELDSVADSVLERMCRSMPSLTGHISTRKLTSRIRQRVAAGDKVVSVVVCTHRPRRVLVRNQLAKHFRRQRWRQNLFEVMTEEELRQLRSYREYVDVYLF